MGIGKKIIGGYVVVLVLLVIAVATGYYTLSNVQKEYSTFIEVDERRIDDVDTLRYLVEAEVADFRAFILYPQDRERYSNEMQTRYRQFDETIERLRKFVLSERGAGESLRLLEEIADLQTRYKEKQSEVILIVREGNLTEAIILSTTDALPLRRELENKIEKFREIELEIGAQQRNGVDATAGRLTLFIIAVSIAALIAGLIIGLYITRSITSQLRDATALLSSSSAEILATTTQLASSASETATAVSEATATTEEVKQTSQLSGEKAKYVLESAQKAASVAQQGKDAVAQNVDAINKIKGQAELVAESIVKLSEQTQAIGEITTSVNDLAEQSNLLAVNAAIEAAKAGEQGKGFAVVAGEIRSLAEQSKQATAQVRTILTDVQKAANAAVMATEQAGKAVDAGVKQATVAGESIGNLADTVMEASQAATQVAASSQQQLVGIDQIASAMENIKQATQQNVAGAKQAEKAAQDLNELGLKLKEIAGGSKV